MKRLVTKAAVEWALAQIDKRGVPVRRKSREWILRHSGREYPPKYVLALAVERLTGMPLSPEEHSGGEETNALLRDLGYEIVANTPTIGRVVVDGQPFGYGADAIRKAESVLFDCLATLPKGASLDFLVTPGGFLEGSLPPGLSGKKGWKSDANDFPKLTEQGASLVRKVVTRRVSKAAKGKCRYLTLGIDLRLGAGRDYRQAQLVALVQLDTGSVVRWTGKSYPTGPEITSLIQVVDLASHVIALPPHRLLILGCHDLNMFSPRARKNQERSGEKWKRSAKMESVVEKFKPTIVLQHPHLTDTDRIWRMPWLSLQRQFQVKTWASGICYCNIDGGKKRAPLQKVLENTRSDSGCVLDFVLKSRSLHGHWH